MVAKQDPQAGMFDVEIDDEDFEAAIREWLALKPTRAELAKITRRIAEGKDRNSVKALEDGTRVRVGDYTFEVKARSGGGFEMPQWETVGMHGLRPIGLRAVE